VVNKLKELQDFSKTHSSSKESDRLVDPAEGGDINSLATDSTLRADTRRVFSGTSVDNSVDENLGPQERNTFEENWVCFHMID